MCDDYTLLTEYDKSRFLGICEHETIHLAWDHATIYFSPEEFMSLGACLDKAITDGNGNFSIEQVNFMDDLKPVCQLWVFNLSLALSTRDFLILTDLVGQAAKSLSYARPRRINSQIHLMAWPHTDTSKSRRNHLLN